MWLADIAYSKVTEKAEHTHFGIAKYVYVCTHVFMNEEY